MSIFRISDDPFGMVLILFPLITFIISLIMQLIIKKKLLIISIIFIGYLVATFTIFNSSFLIWCFIYSGISLIGTLVADLILIIGRKFTK